jgi:hypothetical protein
MCAAIANIFCILLGALLAAVIGNLTVFSPTEDTARGIIRRESGRVAYETAAANIIALWWKKRKSRLGTSKHHSGVQVCGLQLLVYAPLSLPLHTHTHTHTHTYTHTQTHTHTHTHTHTVREMTNMDELVRALENAFPRLRVTVFDSSSVSVRDQVLLSALSLALPICLSPSVCLSLSLARALSLYIYTTYAKTHSLKHTHVHTHTHTHTQCTYIARVCRCFYSVYVCLCACVCLSLVCVCLHFMRFMSIC